MLFAPLGKNGGNRVTIFDFIIGAYALCAPSAPSIHSTDSITYSPISSSNELSMWAFKNSMLCSSISIVPFSIGENSYDVKKNFQKHSKNFKKLKKKIYVINSIYYLYLEFYKKTGRFVFTSLKVGRFVAAPLEKRRFVLSPLSEKNTPKLSLIAE